MSRNTRKMLASVLAICLVAPLCALAAPPAAEPGATYFVSPAGNDAWSGHLEKANIDGTDGPLATLTAARDAARGLAKGVARRIVVLEGEYFFEEALRLDGQDAGLIVEAAPGARVIFYGGRRISGWEKLDDKLYGVALPGVGDRTWDFRSLVVNGRYCPRARYPKEGRLQHETSFDVRWMGTAGGGWQRKPTEEELTTLTYRPDDLGPWLDLNNAELTVYHMWDESVVGLAAMDVESRTLRFSTPARHPPGAFRVKDYVVWNTREGMSEPGQWYLDRTAGKIVYWPLPGEDMAEADVLAPVPESILVIRGTEEKPVRDITIRGIAFSVTNTPLKTGGFGAGNFEGALSAVHTENLGILGVEVYNVGGQGIRTWKCKGMRVEDCHVHHTGACGMMPRGEGAVIARNHIHDVGLTYPSGIALWSGGRVEIRHNEIHDTTYSAIALGGEKTLIEGNLIYHAMEELHDGAAIYVSSGKSTVIRGNFVRDIVDTGGYGASAYYLDELSENCLVEGNLSVNVARPTHNHFVKNNALRNNVFVMEEDGELTFPRSEGYTFENNVVRAGGNIKFTNIDGIAILRNNVLYSGTGAVEGCKLDGYKTQSRVDLRENTENAFADPGLSGLETGAIKFAEGSPALELGITPIDVSQAGREGK